MEFRPHSYQKFAIDKIIELEASGLFLDMGMGKTVSALTAAYELLYDYFTVSKVLVIAPLRVARTTWAGEVHKWDHLKDLEISRVLGSEKQRLEALNQNADIYIINRENVVWLVDLYKKKWPFDMVIIDELSSFKSSSAKRFKALRKVRPYIKKIVGLTGTPAPNGLLDLWPQLYLLDKGERLGETITGYRNRYFTPNKYDRNTGVVFEYKLKENADKVIHKRISDICISMKAKDYLEVPEMLEIPVELELDDKTYKAYKKLEKDLLLPLADSDIEASTAAVLSNKLLQMANGAVYDEHKEVYHLHDEKIKALEEIAEQSQEKPIIVFYNYKHDLSRLKHNFTEARTLDSEKDENDWNNGKIKMLLLHPASAGHGLNLQEGGNTIVWFGLNWSLELYQQANARLHRQGQKSKVMVYLLASKGTMDENVIKAIKHKELGQNILLEAVKAKINEHRR